MKNIYSLVLLFASFCLPAQDRHCATDLVMKAVYDKDPALKIKKHKQDEDQRMGTQRLAVSSTYVIPIVFHVLHMDGPENISDAQVKDGLRILNRDFAKQNPDTVEIITAFKNLADSMKIQFALATKDPFGNCTNGIIHHYDTDTDWDDTSPTLYSHTWDPTMYLNVYLVRTITMSSGFGAAGYTYFPGTFFPGDSRDAIVVLNNYFGSIGTGSNFLSRVLTHEVGHWLDLYHVFGGTNNAGVNCGGDDYVWDTPQSIGYLDCPDPMVPSQYQICNPGVSENFQNYMDYSYCCRMFTSGQGQRMEFALQNSSAGRDNLWTPFNLFATGVANPVTTCAPVADFKYNRSKTCVGTPVTFTDASWNGTPTSYNWSFPGGTPATSTASAPVVTYAASGLYSVNYSSSNSAGTSPVMSKNNIIKVTNLNATYNSLWTEGFENLTTVNNDWTIITTSGGAKWEQSSDAFYSGSYSAELPYSNNTRRTLTSMVSPPINLGGNVGPVLNFKLAAAEISANHINTLTVYSSIDCGNTWNQVYRKIGQALVTSTSHASNFVPTHNEWRAETISMPSLAGVPFANFKFEYVRDTIRGANNIFIDDINITALNPPPPPPPPPPVPVDPVGIEKVYEKSMQGLTVYPVPSKGNLTVEFILSSPMKVKISMYDIAGRMVGEQEEKDFGTGDQKHILNRGNNLSPGIYFLKLEVENKQYTRKIIITE